MTLKPTIFKKYPKQRYGKGFSRGELKKAGLSLREALKLGISVDSRRKTAHKENVNAIKRFLRSKKKASEPKKRKKPKS